MRQWNDLLLIFPFRSSTVASQLSFGFGFRFLLNLPRRNITDELSESNGIAWALESSFHNRSSIARARKLV